MTIKCLEEKLTRLDEKVNMMREIIDMQSKYIESFNIILKTLVEKKTESPTRLSCPSSTPPLQRIVY